MLRQASVKFDIKRKPSKPETFESKHQNPLLRYKSLLIAQNEPSLYDAAKKIQKQRLSSLSNDTTTSATAATTIVETNGLPVEESVGNAITSDEVTIEVNKSNEQKPSREGSLTFETAEKPVLKVLNELEREIFEVATPGREYRRGSRILLGINSSESAKMSKDDSSLGEIKTSALERRSSRADEFRMANDPAAAIASSSSSSSSSAEETVAPETKQEPAPQKPKRFEGDSKGSITKNGIDSKRLRRVHSEPFYFSWAFTFHNQGTTESGGPGMHSYANISVSEPSQAANDSESQPRLINSNSLRACNSFHRIPTLLFNAEGELQVVEDDDDQNVRTAYEAVSRKPSKGASEASFLSPFSDKKEEKGRSISVDYTNSSITPRRLFSVIIEEENTEQNIHCVSVEGKKVVISGTVDQLVLHLYDPREVQQQEYIHIFLLTHRYIFGTSKAMLEKLKQHFFVQEDDAANQKIRRFRIIQIMKRFIENRFYGFLGDKDLRSSMDDFMDQCQLSDGPEKDWANLIQKALSAQEQLELQNNVPRPTPSFSTNSILDFNLQEVAKQLTLIESKMWRDIRCPELFKCAWSKNIDEVAKNVVAITKRFNTVSFWVTTEIVSTTNSSQRLEMLRRFIDIASFLLKLNNFNGAMQIYAALNMGATQRLKSTWKDLSEKYKKKLSEISAMMDSTGNYKNYREELRRRVPPYIPLQSVILGTLTQCEEIPNYSEDGRVNFAKMNTIAKILMQVEDAQNTSYTFTEVPSIRDYVTDLQPMSEDQLYKLAKESEEAALLRGTTRGRAASFYGTLGRRTMRDDLKKAMAMYDEDSKEVKDLAGDLESAVSVPAPVGLKRRTSVQKILDPLPTTTSSKTKSAESLEQPKPKRKGRRGSIMERFHPLTSLRGDQPQLSASSSGGASTTQRDEAS